MSQEFIFWSVIYLLAGYLLITLRNYQYDKYLARKYGNPSGEWLWLNRWHGFCFFWPLCLDFIIGDILSGVDQGHDGA